MIVCVKCDDVLYVGTMPEMCADLEKVMCQTCAFSYAMEMDNYYENMAYDWANDR